jgi:hypothetical protein
MAAKALYCSRIKQFTVAGKAVYYISRKQFIMTGENSLLW